MTPVVAVSAAEIGHPHQLRNHAHQVAAAGAAEHAHDVAAAHAAHPVGIAAAATHVAAVIGAPKPPGIPPPPPTAAAIMPPRPPPPFSIMWLIIGPMVCIIMPKRRLPIFAFIISSIGAIWVIMSLAAGTAAAAELGLRRRLSSG